MNDTLSDIISDIILLDPKLSTGLIVATTIVKLWRNDASVRVIDNKLVEHVRKLTSKDISPQERNELEIRIHELLGILLQIGTL